MARQYAGRKAATTKCKHCSKRFTLKRRDAQFCSAKCRVAYNRDLKLRQVAASGANEGELSVTHPQQGTVGALSVTRPSETKANRHSEKAPRRYLGTVYANPEVRRPVNSVGDPLVGTKRPRKVLHGAPLKVALEWARWRLAEETGGSLEQQQQEGSARRGAEGSPDELLRRDDWGFLWRSAPDDEDDTPPAAVWPVGDGEIEQCRSMRAKLIEDALGPLTPTCEQTPEEPPIALLTEAA